jgi:hypothetical protein
MELLNERSKMKFYGQNHLPEKIIAAINNGKAPNDTALVSLSYPETLQPLIIKFNEFLKHEGMLEKFDREYLEFKTLGKRPSEDFYDLLDKFQSQHDILK